MCVHTCVCKLFFKKKFSETIDWIFTKFHMNVKNFSSPLQKNQACGAIQALKRL